MHTRAAFTMIELVFVIAVLGILAAVAIPKFAATRDDAHIAKARSAIAAVRSGIINERQKRLFRGDNAYINQLHHATTTLFDHNGTVDNTILMYGVTTQLNTNGHWQPSATCTGTPQVCTYKYRIFGSDNDFTYTQASGAFTCVQSSVTAPNCNDLIN